jgi:hypothetical protein
MSWKNLISVPLLLMLATGVTVVGCGGGAGVQPQPQRLQLSAPSPQPTASPVSSPTGAGRSPSPSPSQTLSSRSSPTPSPTNPPSPSPTPRSSASASPTPSATPGPISQRHVLTWDYLGLPYGTTSISWSQAAPFLTWASTGYVDSGSIHAVGIKTTFYTNPNRVTPRDPLYGAPESAFAHTCDGHRVTDVYAGRVVQYVTDPGSATLQTSFVNWVVNPILAAGVFDAIYLDNMGPLSEYNPASFSPSLPCNYSDQSWVAGQVALVSDLPRPAFFNGLSGLNPYGGYGLSLSLGLFQSTNTLGGMWEHCYTQNSTTSQKRFGRRWVANENTELAVQALGHFFICMPSDNYAAPGSPRALDDRLYAYASFLLTYDPSLSILWDFYPAAESGLHVNPESQLVALHPTTPTPTTVADLQQPSGVYAREYSDCYLAGQWVGPCAVVVNPDDVNSHPFPYTKYHHTLVLQGAGILDGGTVTTQGPAPPSTVPALESVIAFR